MSKKKAKKQKSSQFPSSQTSPAKAPSMAQNAPTPENPNPPPSSASNSSSSLGQRIQPEQMSLTAHAHIQTYLNETGKSKLNKDDVTAILRLAQHLRVFGLLSAVGYLNQSNAQQGKVRERTEPVWKSLLGQLIEPDNPPNAEHLMANVVEMASQKPSEYLAAWRRSLILANHWNFWARAYQEEKPCTPTTVPTPESN
jgi:hypothetical protein